MQAYTLSIVLYLGFIYQHQPPKMRMMDTSYGYVYDIIYQYNTVMDIAMPKLYGV